MTPRAPGGGGEQDGGWPFLVTEARDTHGCHGPGDPRTADTPLRACFLENTLQSADLSPQDPGVGKDWGCLSP